MLPERRAVIFDLDDTLYPYRRFKLSGFVALAAKIAGEYGCDRRAVLRVFMRATRGPARGHEVQICLAALQLPPALAGPLVRELQSHEPRLRLSSSAVRMLQAMRRDGWRLAIVTNGDPAVQAAKVAALQVAAAVDAVIYAAEHGSGIGKPEPHAFIEACRQLDVPASQTVVIGDSEETDIPGAIAAGMHPVRCAVWTRGRPVCNHAIPVVRHLSRVPDLARSLLTEVPRRHVA